MTDLRERFGATVSLGLVLAMGLPLSAGAQGFGGGPQLFSPADKSDDVAFKLQARLRLDDGVTLERCVVWAGTRVGRSASNAVLTPAHRLEIS